MLIGHINVTIKLGWQSHTLKSRVEGGYSKDCVPSILLSILKDFKGDTRGISSLTLRLFGPWL